MAFPPRFGRNDNSEYPPNRLNGQSPYFIGKPKKPRRDGEGAPTVCRVPGLGGSNTDTARDEIYIDDMESDSEVQFLSRKKAVPTSINNSKGMAFDFGDDPKLASVRKGILEIVDPDGSRKDSAALMSTIAASTSRSMDLVNGRKEKRPKPLQRKGLASMDDFRMANGAPIVKEMKQVVPRSADNSDESQSDTGYYSGALPKRRVPSFTAPVSTSALIKKGLAAMNMGVVGGSKEEQLTGLLAEPSLKHFDQNIINLIESEIMSVTTETGWSDVAGLDGAKKALREIVVLPFKRPDVFKGIRAPPKGVLLFGPPGTGKTMIGKCVASQCQATFFNISASSLTSKWVGEGEKLVRALFAVARIKLPSVIFIDEIDSLLSARSESEHESSRRIKTEFLVQLDGVATNSDERLLVLGATNRPQELDEAARRRFAKRLYIALPESIARLSIVENLLKGMRHNIVDADLTKVAALTDGYSGADMRQLCAEASLGPIRDIENSSTLDIETVDEQDIRPINASDFENAALVVRPTVVDEDLVAYQKWDKKFGCLL